eukprot:COSAG06_NODE_1648_length_8810_cov_22.992194_13_plen_203_part_00
MACIAPSPFDEQEGSSCTVCDSRTKPTGSRPCCCCLATQFSGLQPGKLVCHECASCDSGQMCNRHGENAGCADCAAGRYNDRDAASGCVDCPTGKSSDPGAVECTDDLCNATCRWGLLIVVTALAGAGCCGPIACGNKKKKSKGGERLHTVEKNRRSKCENSFAVVVSDIVQRQQNTMTSPQQPPQCWLRMATECKEWRIGK